MKILAGAALAGALVCAGAYFGSPFLAVQNLQQSARSGDREKLEEAVDFPAVRDSLKAQFNAKLMSEMQNDASLDQNPFAGFAMAFAPMIIEKAVDAYVTPESIAAMAKGQKPQVDPAAPSAETAPPAEEAQESDEKPPKTDYSFVTLDRFKATYSSPDGSYGSLGLVFERRNVIGWKLVRIDIPLDAAPAETPPTASP